jgi:hypothetical protein
MKGIKESLISRIAFAIPNPLSIICVGAIALCEEQPDSALPPAPMQAIEHHGGGLESPCPRVV